MSWLILLFAPFLHSFETTLGLHQMQEKVQNISGDRDSNPHSPMLTLGAFIDTEYGFWFMPHIGYIQNKVNSDDTFSPYKIETIVLGYDFVWIPETWENVGLRFGFSNFMKKVSDSGAAVTIPNGSGTATAYRPGSSTSHTATWNLGADINLQGLIEEGPSLQSIYDMEETNFIKGYGARFQINIFSPLEKKRTMGYHLAAVLYF